MTKSITYNVQKMFGLKYYETLTCESEIILQVHLCCFNFTCLQSLYAFSNNEHTAKM